MKNFQPILLKLYIFLLIGLTFFCHAQNKQTHNPNGSGNPPNACNAQNPYQFGVDFGDVQSPSLTKEQIDQAVDIASANCIKLIRVYDQLQSDDNWTEFMTRCVKNDIKVIVGISNEYLYTNRKNIAVNITNFVKNYILPYQSNITTILVGNELNNDPHGVELIQNYLNSYINEFSQALSNVPKISIGLSIGGSGPHGNDGDFGAFNDFGYCALNPNLNTAVTLLSQQKNYKLFLNIYSFFSGGDIANNQAIYGDLKGCFDTFNKSLSCTKTTCAHITISSKNMVVGETGWPSAGSNPKHPPSIDKTYANMRCIMHGVLDPNENKTSPPSQVLFFELFDEDKPNRPDYESHFGLFTNLKFDPQKNPQPGTKKANIPFDFDNPTHATCPN